MVFTGWHVDRDPKQTFRSHRCDGSLRRYMSIRWIPKDGKWWLIDPEPCWDGDFSKYWMNKITPIRYCPYCGERLWPLVLETGE